MGAISTTTATSAAEITAEAWRQAKLLLNISLNRNMVFASLSHLSIILSDQLSALIIIFCFLFTDGRRRDHGRLRHHCWMPCRSGQQSCGSPGREGIQQRCR